MKKIISYALWGDQELYIEGAVNNILGRDKFFPGWICRFYIDSKTIPLDIQNKLRGSEGVEVVEMPQADDVLGMFWRFRPMWDDQDIERFLVRDTDCQFTERERSAVAEWEKSDQPFHIIRDNHYHNIPILGGTWGAIPGCIDGMKEASATFLLNVKQTNSQHKSRKYHGVDQIFLCQYVWPQIEKKHIAHIRAGEPGLVFTGSERILPPLEDGGHFVGMPCAKAEEGFRRVESHLIEPKHDTKKAYDKLCIMLPTYKRPDRLRKFILSALKHATDPHCLRFCFCVNKKDTDTIVMLEEMYWPSPLAWEIVFESTRQPNLSLYFNMMYDKTRFNDDGTLVSMFGDDMVFVSNGWDEKFLAAMNAADGNAIVFGDDAFIAHEKLTVHFVTSRKIVKATGLPFMCTKYHAEMIDVVWTNIGQTIGILKYMPDVIIKHDHDSGKTEDKWDETFRRLCPLRKMSNNQDKQRHAIVWATIASANLIKNGIGQWNVL